MKIIQLHKANNTLIGDITLDGSKSISNRALIVMAMAKADASLFLSQLSGSKDTQTLQRLLADPTADLFDAGDAGTTFRFMTAFLALQEGEQVLTGSARMRERPVGALVAALNSLGANIQFMEKEGYPPLRIGAFQYSGQSSIRISADVSSQFLSALALIAPYLPQGLVLIPEGDLVSRPYIDMTLALMRYFGAEAQWEDEQIVIRPGRYQAKPLVVEADWSAASYWFSMATLADEVDLHLRGLQQHSWQGDAALVPMLAAGKKMATEGMLPLARNLQYSWKADESLHLFRSAQAAATPRPEQVLEKDFLECPDIAQTFAVTCAGLGMTGIFTGLETLSIKETDRILALKQELAKVGVSFSKLPRHFSKKHPEKTYFLLSGKAGWTDPPQFATYGDHRMAMAFAPLAFKGAIRIEDPAVVAKSYPGFWIHLEALGFSIQDITSGT
jgi:3-phosphoshikimate 1-carboxyvinyltransferase